ncbi:MAG: AMP-binding protein [Hyphomicrobiaceae bacterium]|nr:AMP-binding protein [Hyphomicrobiaceae bacterium]
MGEVRDGITIAALWREAVDGWADRPFLAVPPGKERAYLPDGLEITYSAADAEIGRLAEDYASAGYGLGHRVAMLLENRPEHVLHRLALNSIGASCVPINPDYRAAETAYLLEHSEPALVLTIGSRQAQIEAALAESRHRPAVWLPETGLSLPRACVAATSTRPEPATEAQILYTSGTTGRPKGCILSHGYEVSLGDWYAKLGGMAALRPGKDRIYNPLPLYHLNAGVVSLLGAVAAGCCQVQTDRFNPTRWWPEVKATRATIVHYLGIVAPMLLNQPVSGGDRDHVVRFGIGAGIEPELHAVFEERFGFPLIEIWGMTEFCRVLGDNHHPRKIGTRAFGKAVPGFDVRVVDEQDRDVPDGTPGEMVVRHSAETPRRAAFSGYLKNDEETEKGWRSGWFHTGDTVRREADGMLHFIDRKKNIIRRSGENIAAAEIEALLLTHPDIAQAAVMAAKDEVREEEVLACVVTRSGDGGRETAEEIFRYCNERLAYYKAPGWIWFARELPTTGTQKIQKHVIFPANADPREVAGMIDLRSSKRRR